jgi:hypothetical protein
MTKGVDTALIILAKVAYPVADTTWLPERLTDYFKRQ